jgi:NTE family protein
MNVQLQPHLTINKRDLPFECIALVLQGGGALGAYQAGVYEALAEAHIKSDWVAGVSIGAINAAIIAGNEPTERVAKLRAFWREITASPLLDWVAAAGALTPKGDLPHCSTRSARPAHSSAEPGAFSRFVCRLPGCMRTALGRRRASTKPRT